jgi:hypothetical protein
VTAVNGLKGRLLLDGAHFYLKIEPQNRCGTLSCVLAHPLGPSKHRLGFLEMSVLPPLEFHCASAINRLPHEQCFSSQTLLTRLEGLLEGLSEGPFFLNFRLSAAVSPSGCLIIDTSERRTCQVIIASLLVS